MIMITILFGRKLWVQMRGEKEDTGGRGIGEEVSSVAKWVHC
jgi:hypothetical protein